MHERPHICRLTHLAAAVLYAALAGCSSGGQNLLSAPSGLAINSSDALKSSTDALKAGTDAVKNVKLPKLELPPAGSPTEIYTRVARGAGLCWFGAHGVLKPSHIFHAQAQPPSRGGESEIVIHERDPSMPNPRGAKAFRIKILPNGDNASMEIENLRFPAEVGERMSADVRRWARDDLTCQEATPAAGWDAQNGPAPPAEPPKSAKKQRKS